MRFRSGASRREGLLHVIGFQGNPSAGLLVPAVPPRVRLPLGAGGRILATVLVDNLDEIETAMKNGDIVFNEHVQGLLAVGEARHQQDAKQALQPGILEVGSASSGGDFFQATSALELQDKETFTHQAYHSLQGQYRIHS